MKLGYTMMPGRGDMDLLLAGLADRLEGHGLTVAGVVQVNTDCGPDRPCDMDLRMLPKGGTLRISQTLGTGARGCRLDAAALEVAVSQTEQALAGADLLLINKFGKHEATGRGFRPVIAAAMEAGVPVLCGLNGANLEAFETFTDGLAEALQPDIGALENWVLAKD